jgi:hypothetical protein
MQIFILLLPPFSIIFHVPGSAGGDVVAVGSEIGSAGKGICACGRRIAGRAVPMPSGRSERLPGMSGGGCGIRTREGVNSTRFPSPQNEVQVGL